MSYFELLAIVRLMPKTETHVTAGILAPANEGQAHRDPCSARARVLDGDGDRDVLRRQLRGARRYPRGGDRRGARADVDEELGHARKFAARIKELYGTPPGSLAFTAEQASLQPPADATDVVSVIRGVIEAEAGAIEHYTRLIEACDGVDWATQDMVIDILRDEEGHLRTFERYLREFD